MNEFQVLGPPGTGKTTFLSNWIAQAADKYGPERMFVASFTRAAAAELVSRDLPIPDDCVGTLHRHCYRALGSPEIAEGHLKEWNDACGEPGWHLSGGRISLEDEGDVDVTDGQDAGDPIMRDIQQLRARMVPHELWPVSAEAFWQRWSEWKDETGFVDFTDLIERCLGLSEFAPGAPDVGFFDEVQDFTKLELSLVRHWGSGMEYVVLAGDDDQCLYRFKGASPDAFMLPDMDTEHRRVLAQSYRVPVAAWEYASRWIDQLSHREEKAYLPRDYRGRVVSESITMYDTDVLAAQAEDAAEHGKSIMFLGSCSRHVEPIKAALRSQGIPFHNPYRRSRGDWNPLAKRRGTVSSADRLVAYLCPDERIWTSDELRNWSDLVQADRVFVHGGKKALQSFPREVPLTRERLEEVFRPDVLSSALRKDDRWLRSVLLKTKEKALEFPLRVYDRGGIPRLQAPPKVVIGTIHCSPPDELIRTRRGDVPIAEIQSDDRLISYTINSNRLLGIGNHLNSRGYEFKRSERLYDGDLVVIESDESRTRVTPNHRVLARLKDDFFNRWVVYLMRRGNWWRVGICTSGARPYKTGGIAGRLATEQADAGWVLAVCDTREEAIATEARVQARYGIPGLTFEAARQRILTSAQLHAIHDDVREFVEPRAHALLRSIGSDPLWPLYRRGDGWKKNMRSTFTVEAGTLALLSKWVTVPTIGGGLSPVFVPAQLYSEPYQGMVYGLDVPPYHHYVSGGAVVHNSVKGGEADTVVVFPDLSIPGYEEWMDGAEGQDSVIRQYYVAFTRARENLVLCEPATRFSADWLAA